jgi:hypothetical protein
VSDSCRKTSQQLDDAAGNTELLPTFSRVPKVALDIYFHVLGINGTLIYFLPGRIKPGVFI